jgi:serine phosphatase RsbU (regulator of sigma subunit)
LERKISILEAFKSIGMKASQMILARGALGVGLVLSLFAIGFLFVDLINRQNESLNPNIQRTVLKKDNKILELPSWKATFMSCEASLADTSECLQLGAEIDLSFPAIGKIPELIKQVSNPDLTANSALVEKSFTETELSFLSDREFVALIIPRTVQNSARVSVGAKTWNWYGNASDAVFTLRSKDLLVAKKISIQFDFREFPWFGPAELPMALADIDAVADYSSLFHRQVSSFNLSRQMEIGFPLLLAAMAIVLDHSKVFAILSLYAGSRAVRSFVPFVVEAGTTLTWVHEILAMLANAAATIFIVKFAIEISAINNSTWMQLQLKKLGRLGLKIAEGSCYFLCLTFFFSFWKFNPSLAWLKGDLVADSIGAFVSILICFVGCVFALRKDRNANSNSKKISSFQNVELNSGLSEALFFFRIALILVAFVFSLVANLEDLMSVSQNSFRNALDWKHTALVPILITAALLDVGSTARKMLNFGKDMANKALLEKELQVGKEVQHRMLPKLSHSDYAWAWRSLYAPAQALAGDWFDIKELVFPCGRKILGVCVADVTGHGVGSSLATSVICSHWNLWCSEVTQHPAPRLQADREKLLQQAPVKIHQGLLALPQNEQCTAILALLDPLELELTASTCGHPGAIITKGREFAYLSSPGDRLGASDTVGQPWTTKTLKVELGSKIYFYSDGVLPPGSTVSSFASALRRRLKSEDFSVSEALWKQFRANRKKFKLNRDLEDDMTLLCVELFNKKVEKELDIEKINESSAESLFATQKVS